MSTIEQLDQLTQLAREAGYEVRHEYFGGTGGGFCEVAGRKILFLDLALSSVEQLDKLKEIYAQESELADLSNQHRPAA